MGLMLLIYSATGTPGAMMMDVADDCLGARVDGDMLDADGLLPFAPHACQRFDLPGEGPLKLHSKIAVPLDKIVPIRGFGAAKHLHGEGMAAGHLNGECRFQFVLGSYRLHDREPCVDVRC